MYISKFQLNNYKSYLSATPLELTTGFNILTGQNNAGKTALLEALSLNLVNKPHRSLQTLPTPNGALDSTSWANVEMVVSQAEFSDALRAHQSLVIPLPAFGTPEILAIPIANDSPEQLNKFFDWILSHKNYILKINIDGHGNILSDLSKYPSFGLYKSFMREENNWQVATFTRNPDKSFSYTGLASQSDRPSDVGHGIFNIMRGRIYTFKAERFNLGTCHVGPSRNLAPQAQNLAEVLSNLQTNTKRFLRFNETVRRVLPQIQQVSVRNINNQQLEILVWTENPEQEREDLATPLDECGTGVGQVLAILYVVLNSDFSRTILIDEPQSFLHPGAVRKLIEVLKEHPQHQYILATHSPTVITATNPSTITLIKQEGAESKFQTIDPTENAHLRDYLAEIGARLSDAFGADNILWVEGATEEICFPMILEKVAKRSLMGTAIIGVKHTGDLEGKHAKTVFEIYDRLSKGQGLLPPAIGFIFDKEKRTEQEQNDIERMSNNLVSFTPCRLYENYLLNSKAIAAVVNEIEGFRHTPITEIEVETWIETNKHDKKYGTPSSDSKKLWTENIHGAKLLEDLFNDLSEAKVFYDKVTHSVALTRWLIENSPEDLREIADLIQRKLS